ncbi:unnamed protein product [Didymodactylos carnosus]|uniref:Uncharacterized protein n=1 Tax=Didymodactylos carnosus TaxID=1234261 RepID=A0A813NU57_9BILA|nr:unnamed protein product [Didymodactylos carnosus]CAF0740631.1 unnamed protein product [Didymodactylos carnosus]CAF3497228.1 unnamed protein product [Didymodactylos carnosus]CAF3518899.1 unnamed protein product [Didymodactylos carnosus]
MVLVGKQKALENISKSSITFIGKLANVEKGISSVTMPPVDNYTLRFDHDYLKTIRGRVYDTMTEFLYHQLGEGIMPALEDLKRGSTLLKKQEVKVPTVGKIYVVCLFEDIKHVDQLIEISQRDADEIIKLYPKK